MIMPERKTVEKARKDKRAGKAPTTQAGEFVREEIRKIRRGEHGARSPQQAIAIGLSKARRAGVGLRPPGRGKAKERTRRSAAYAYAAGQHKRKTHRQPRVSRAVSRVLKREPRSTVSRAALSRQARRGAQGGADERLGAPFCRSTQGGSHQGTTQEIGRQGRLERACPRPHCAVTPIPRNPTQPSD